MLRCDDRVDNGSKVVDIGKCLDAQNNVIECAFSRMCGIFGIPDNCSVNWLATQP